MTSVNIKEFIWYLRPSEESNHMELVNFQGSVLQKCSTYSDDMPSMVDVMQVHNQEILDLHQAYENELRSRIPQREYVPVCPSPDSSVHPKPVEIFYTVPACRDEVTFSCDTSKGVDCD